MITMYFNLKFLDSGQISCNLLILNLNFAGNFSYQNNKNQLCYSCVDVSMHPCPISFCVKLTPCI